MKRKAGRNNKKENIKCKVGRDNKMRENEKKGREK